jgi:hypothetical protein
VENENEVDVAEILKKSKMDVKAESFNIWKCLACEGEPEFEHVAMMRHLQEVHGIDTKTTRASRKMLQHCDGREWYQTNFELEVNGLKFINYCRNARAKNDMMRFA